MLFAQVVARWDRAGGRKKGAEMKEGELLKWRSSRSGMATKRSRATVCKYEEKSMFKRSQDDSSQKFLETWACGKR